MNKQHIKKEVVVYYFAILRDQRGLSQETIETTAATLSELYEELKEKYRFKLPVDFLKVAVNEQFADWQTQLNRGDTVIFIPPVSGG